VDLGLAFLVNWAIFGLIMIYHESQFMETLRFQERNREVLGRFERTLWLLCFVFLEGIGGASLGKWLAGLRVNRVDRGGPPGLGWGLVRALVFYAATELPANILPELPPPIRGHRMQLTCWDALIIFSRHNEFLSRFTASRRYFTVKRMGSIAG